MNSLLSYFAEAENISGQIVVCCQFAEKTKFDKNDTCISLNLSNEICNILLGNDHEITDDIITVDDENKNLIKTKLLRKRNYALHSAIDGGKEEYKNLNELLQNLTAVFFKNLDVHESERENIWLEILQVLQGICLWLKKFDTPLIALVSRESSFTSDSDCVGEFFILGKNNSAVSTFCEKVFPLVDNIQRYYFKTVLSHIPPVSKDTYNSLEFALQNRYDREKITNLLENTVFNFNSLAGVIRLSEVIRPFAVHEGKQRTIFFVVGYPFLLKDKLKPISEFSKDNINIDDDIRDKIKWEIPGDELKRPTENEALHRARARIMGSSQILQNPGVALFVDCNEDKPSCSYIVKPAPRGTIGFNTNIVDVMASVTTAFIVKIIGQKKIEIFHKGRKILVWSHINATWEEESTWDKDSLKNFISEKLSVNSVNNDAVKIIAETAYQISQTSGQGASFVISKENVSKENLLYPEMTNTFPELGEGKIKESKILSDIAIEDGGTLIDLKSNNFYGRRQWLPHKNGIPFWYKTFTIPKEEWKWAKLLKRSEKQLSLDDVKQKDKNPTIYTYTELVDNQPPKKLYMEICKFKYLYLQKENYYIVNPWYWDAWYKVLTWGTRHMASMGMSACFWDRAVVIVVSTDSTITVFYEGIEQRPSNE